MVGGGESCLGKGQWAGASGARVWGRGARGGEGERKGEGVVGVGRGEGEENPNLSRYMSCGFCLPLLLPLLLMLLQLQPVARPQSMANLSCSITWHK